MGEPVAGAVMVIAKAPRLGHTKTRLCPPLTPEQACEVAWACLHDTLAAVAAVPCTRHVLVLDGDPGVWVPDGFELIPQRGEGLAARLAAAFADVADDAVVIAMDTPQVGVDTLTMALHAVVRHPGVASFGPAADGGYWLLGLPRAVDPAAVFAGVPMSTADTGSVQRARLVELGLAVVEVDVLRDVDTTDDLAAVVPSLAPSSHLARLVARGSRFEGGPRRNVHTMDTERPTPSPLVAPLGRYDRADLDPLFSMVEARNGYLPNSMLTMARVPGLVEGFAALAGAVLGPGAVSAELKSLVSLVASTAAGCRYCQAHTSTTASHTGAADAKVAAVWEFETSPLFDEAERAALRLARDAAQVPNLVDATHRESLLCWFSEAQVVELVAVVSLFGYLNRWNDTMGTPLEDAPLATAGRLIGERGWHAGKHGPSPAGT